MGGGGTDCPTSGASRQPDPRRACNSSAQAVDSRTSRRTPSETKAVAAATSRNVEEKTATTVTSASATFAAMRKRPTENANRRGERAHL